MSDPPPMSNPPPVQAPDLAAVEARLVEFCQLVESVVYCSTTGTTGTTDEIEHVDFYA